MVTGRCVAVQILRKTLPRGSPVSEPDTSACMFMPISLGSRKGLPAAFLESRKLYRDCFRLNWVLLEFNGIEQGFPKPLIQIIYRNWLLTHPRRCALPP